ncbi:hypothetical protein NLX71_24295 [Paenibacillus sp. MZ04-78.2]|uniref:hypothetical protein n=1 Tax=Paenibacillus sp. MZ04-78.2 TaxID=2962034 RepID=UPI0020B87E97|nr:hypothetical protein [Paenibacillus sp. MZ04-78.2]MCP3776381.1 hypothetical protein [Paenibacillus sp. MZ04-78.2]
MLISTIVSGADLPKAVLMAQSVKQHMQNAVVVVCLAEEAPPQIDAIPYVDVLILAKHLGAPYFYQHLFKFTPMQCASALKGQLFRYLLSSFPNESHFIYVDTNMYITGPFSELSALLQTSHIILCPHLLEPVGCDAASEIGALRDGTFHGGLVAVKRSDEGERFVSWWVDVIASHYEDPLQCVFMDQKWLNFVPACFDAAVMRHPGYNVGFWNLHESKRRIVRAPHGYEVGGLPLRCINLFNLMGLLDQNLNAFIPDRSNSFYKLRHMYTTGLAAMSGIIPAQTSWSYDFYQSGERISDAARATYKAMPMEKQRDLNPFTVSNQFYV